MSPPNDRPPHRRAGRQSQCRQERAVQRADRRAAEDRQLCGRHGRAQGGAAGAAIGRAGRADRPARQLWPACHQPGRGSDPQGHSRRVSRRSRARRAGGGARCVQSRTASGLRAGSDRAGQADSRRAQHDRSCRARRAGPRSRSSGERAGRAGDPDGRGAAQGPRRTDPGHRRSRGAQARAAPPPHLPGRTPLDRPRHRRQARSSPKPRGTGCIRSSTGCSCIPGWGR